MVRHVILWKLKEMPETEKAAVKAGIKAGLEGLAGQIPGLLRLEVGRDFSATENSSDVVLVTAFATKADLAAYQIHPAHKAVGVFVREVVSERRMIDYETP